MLQKFANDGKHLMIDLHGCSVADTKRIIKERLKNVEASKLAQLYIITGWGKHVNPGGGRGVLKKILPKLLKPYQTEIVEIYEDKGAYQVVLKNHVRQKNVSKDLLSLFPGCDTDEGKIRLLKIYELEGKQGNFDALLCVAFAHLYHDIKGYSDPAQGLILLEQARAKGSLDACVGLGELYSDGVVVTRDDKKALGYFKEAAEGGDALGQYRLAVCYLSGRCIKLNDVQGAVWMKKSADGGCAFAQHALGESYFTGDFTEQNLPLSLKYMQLSASQNVTAAQVHLARCYGSGSHGVSQNSHQAFHYYWLGAQKDDLFAIYQVAAYLGNGRLGTPDLEASFRWFLKGAELRDVDCQADVAIYYFLGKGVKEDVNQSMYWCKKALEAGSRGADWLMSEAYRLGKGVEKDPKKWFEHLTKAAEKGFEPAQKTLERFAQYKEKNTASYSFAERKKIPDTTLIMLLNKKTSLTFFGVRDEDYKVDAVAEISDKSMEEKAVHLKNQLGYGQFFTIDNKKHFLLEGINLSEGDFSVGKVIQRELK